MAETLDKIFIVASAAFIIVMLLINMVFIRQGYYVKMTFGGEVITSRISRRITRNNTDMYMDYNKKEISLWLRDGDEAEVIVKLNEWRGIIGKGK